MADTHSGTGISGAWGQTGGICDGDGDFCIGGGFVAPDKTLCCWKWRMCLFPAPGSVQRMVLLYIIFLNVCTY